MTNKIEEGEKQNRINNIHDRKDKWLGLVRVYERLYCRLCEDSVLCCSLYCRVCEDSVPCCSLYCLFVCFEEISFSFSSV